MDQFALLFSVIPTATATGGKAGSTQQPSAVSLSAVHQLRTCRPGCGGLTLLYFVDLCFVVPRGNLLSGDLLELWHSYWESLAVLLQPNSLIMNAITRCLVRNSSSDLGVTFKNCILITTASA